MKREEAKELLKEIQALYPMFNKERDPEIAKIWIDRLEVGNFQKSKTKLKEYSTDNPWPPSLADVLVKEHKPHQQVDMTIKEDRERVAAEMADPKKRAEREEKLKKLAAMEERMRKDVYERTDT